MSKPNRVIKWVERRIKTRHKAPGLSVSLRPTGIIGFFRPAVKVECIDFNRYGMAIESPVQLNKRERLVASFKGKYFSASNVSGVVKNVVKQDDGAYRVSIVFAYAITQKEYCRRVDNSLSKIERFYHDANNNSCAKIA